MLRQRMPTALKVPPPVVPNVQENEENAVLTEGDKEILVMYWQRYCDRSTSDVTERRYQTVLGQPRPKFCEDLLSKLSKFEGINVLSMTASSMVLGGHVDEGVGLDMPKADLLAGISTILSQTVRHLIIPPSVSRLTPFSKRISFLLYIVMNQREYDPREAMNGVDIVAIKRAISAMSLPIQDVTISEYTMRLDDDPHLAMAYHTSIRTQVVPQVDDKGNVTCMSYASLMFTNSTSYHVPG